MAAPQPDLGSAWNLFLQVFLLALGGLAAVGAWMRGRFDHAPPASAPAAIDADELRAGILKELEQVVEASNRSLGVRIEQQALSNAAMHSGLDSRIRSAEIDIGRHDERLHSLERRADRETKS